jgi:hypothetical protein
MNKKDNPKKKQYVEKTSYYFVTDSDEKLPAGDFASTIHYLALHILREFTDSYLKDIKSSAKYGRAGKLVMINDILSRQESGEFNLENCSMVIAKFIMSYFTIVKTDEFLSLSNREIRMLEFVIKKDLDMTIESSKEIVYGTV